MREHGAGELVHHQLGRLQVHVRVEEPRHKDMAPHVGFPRGVVAADAGDVFAADRDVGLEHLPGKDRQHPAALEHEIGRLVAAGHGEPPPHRIRALLGRRIVCRHDSSRT